MNERSQAPAGPAVQLKTVGDIAREVGTGTHRVQYVVDRDKIEPDQRAGNLRLYAEAKVRQIKDALAAIDAA